MILSICVVSCMVVLIQQEHVWAIMIMFIDNVNHYCDRLADTMVTQQILRTARMYCTLNQILIMFCNYSVPHIFISILRLKSVSVYWDIAIFLLVYERPAERVARNISIYRYVRDSQETLVSGSSLQSSILSSTQSSVITTTYRAQL